METTKIPTALITGASGGIGEALTRLMAARGARCALSGRREQRLTALAEDVAAAGGERPAVLAADLGRPGEAAALAERALEALGSVDVLINNAGATLQALTWVAGDRPEARAVVETNLWSPLALAAALAPGMLESGQGAIVNVGSMAWVSPFPHLGHYAASRAALAAATQVMEMEMGPRGVRIVEVSLGPVDSPASRETRRLAGADPWLDGRPGLSSVGAAAEVIADAALGDARGVVFHPRMLRWPHRFPALGRHYSRRTSRGADLHDEAVRFGGSSGDAELRGLREQWVGNRDSTT